MNIMTSIKSLFAKGTDREYIIAKYPPARREFDKCIIDNMRLSGRDSRLLDNPHRGMRGEVDLALGSGGGYPEDNDTAYERLEHQLNLYADDHMNIVQLYLYLNEYCRKPLDQHAYNQLTEYFETLRAKNIKVLFRIAYMYSDKINTDATDKMIIAHLDGIGGWIRDHYDLFNHTVYAAQLGILGLWGEGHGSKYRHNIEKLSAKLIEILPDGIYLQCRTPYFLSRMDQRYEDRYCIHDDMLVGFEHVWGMIPWSHPQYQDLLNKNQYGIADGEMPWGRDTTVPVLDPLKVVCQIVDYGLTSLSLTHNYKENRNGETDTFHLEKWKKVYFDKRTLDDNRLPYLPTLLENNKISVYDYLQYHLGYLMGVSNLEQSDNGISFIISNYGMAAPHEYILEIFADGKRLDIPEHKLKRFDQQTIYADRGTKEIKIRYTHRRTGEHFRLANKCEYTSDGFNIFKLSEYN